MRTMNWIWGAALLAVAPACKMNDTPASNDGKQTDQVTAEQKKAEDAFKKAGDAQKQAIKQQDQAKKAAADVQKAQTDLREKEQKAQQALTGAQQSQVQAQQQGQVAQQTAVGSQQKATEALTQQQAQQQQASTTKQQASAEASAPASPGEQQVSGKLAKASDTELRLESVEQPLKIDSSTQVTLDGQTSSAAQLQLGSDVRASYRPDRTATRVAAKSPQK